MRSGLSLFVPIFVFLGSVDANLNLSSHRIRRIGHTSHPALPRTLHADRFARHINARGDGDGGGLLGDLGGVLGGATNGVGSTANGLGNGVDSIAGGAGDTLGLGGSNSPPSQDGDPSNDGSPSGSSPSTTSASNSSSSTTDSASDNGAQDHGAPTPTVPNHVPVTPSPTSTSSSGGLLGGIGDGLSNIAGGAGTGLSQIGGGIIAPPTPTPSPPEASPGSGDPDAPPPDPTTPSDGGLLPLPLPTILPAPSPPPSPSDSGSSAAGTSSDGGLLPISIPPILAPPPSSSDSDSSTDVIVPDPTQTDTPSNPSPTPTGSNDGGILPPLTSILPLPPVTSILPPVTSILPPVTSILPPILPPPTTSPTLTILPDPTDSPLPIPPITIPGGSNDTTTTPGPSTITDAPPSTITDAPANVTTTDGSNGTAITGSGNSTTVLTIPTTSLFPNTTTGIPEPLTTVTTTSTDAVDSQFSFITASSLVTATMTATSPSITQTDPDAVISSTIIPTPASQGAAPVVPTLPPNLPQRIFSPNSVNPSTDSAELDGMTLISLLFTAELNWHFMNQSEETVGQVFAYMPKLISFALGIDDSVVKTYALQVEIPEGWAGDLDKLGTMYLCYVPNDQVDLLSSLIKAQTSNFYHQPGVQGQLAQFVRPDFSLMSVSAGSVGGNDASSGTGGSGSPSKSNKTRTDAIIGVCAAIAGVAALVAVWWSVRYVQRKRAAKHRRLSNLSDPNASNGVYGTQHDDRRTSFFYAEDELRGGYRPQDAPGFTHPAQPQAAEESVMQQRRPAMPHAPISAPVLQENSLNW